MTWTKVTDALPPDGEAVMVTVLDGDGERFVEYRAMYDYAMKKWVYFDVFNGRYEEFSRYHTVTHWAERVRPAED